MTGNNLSAHVEFEVLSDFVDGYLSPDARAQVERHLAECSACSDRREELTALLRSSAGLPKSVLPPVDIWPDLKRALNSTKEVSLPTASSPMPTSTARRSTWRTAVALVAAAVVLIVLSSAITALVLRRSPTHDITQHEARTEPAKPVALPANFRRTELEYQRTIDQLQFAVNSQRGRLSPETVRTVDHSLAVVDSAIAEARAALLADPNNGMLVDLLSASYQRKLDLLQRTSELAPRT